MSRNGEFKTGKFRSEKLAGKSFPSEIDDLIVADPVMSGALKHFKASVDAWSEAAYSRPKSVARTAQHTWRLAASWALGCLLIVGSCAGGLYEHHQRQEAVRATEMKAAEQKAELIRAAAEQPVTPAHVATNIAIGRQPKAVKRAVNTDEDLLATVDNDVSRQVPAAMEPLAQMMDGNGTN
jgi:hypothetical protein